MVEISWDEPGKGSQQNVLFCPKNARLAKERDHKL